MSESEDIQFIGVQTERLKERAEAERSKFSPRSPAVWLSIKSGGEYLVRLLPPWTAEGPHAFSPYLKMLQHWDVGPQLQRVQCPTVQKDWSSDPCPCYVCEQVEMLKATKDPADAQRASRLRASGSYIYQAIDRDDPFWKKGDEGLEDNEELLGKPKIKFLRLPKTANDRIIDFYNDAEYGDLSDLFTGTDIKITRTGEGRKTVYGITPRRNSTPLFGTPEEPDKVAIKAALEGLYAMDEHPFFRLPTYDETKAVYTGLEAETPAQVGGAPTPAGALPPGANDLSLWVARGKESSAMTLAEVAAWGGWTSAQIPECYGQEPDHMDDGCQGCPVNGPCSAVYQKAQGTYSVNAQKETPPTLSGKTTKLGGKSAPAPEATATPVGEQSVEDMASMLEAASKK